MTSAMLPPQTSPYGKHLVFVAILFCGCPPATEPHRYTYEVPVHPCETFIVPAEHVARTCEQVGEGNYASRARDEGRYIACYPCGSFGLPCSAPAVVARSCEIL